MIGIGIGLGRQRFGIFSAYQSRIIADGGVTEGGTCVDAVSSLLQSASLLLVPSGYKGGKLYAEIPTNGNGDLTWTRASDAFRTNASGLIQRVPWNLALQSETFDNASWTKNTGGTSTVTVTANNGTAPNGTNTADRIQFTRDSTGYAQVVQTITTTASQSYTFSVYLKSLSGTPTVMFGSYGGTNAQTATLTNEWVRYTWTATSPSTSAFGMLMIWGGVASTSFSADFLAWGYQLVEGTTAQTYLPTTDRLNFPRLSYMYASCPSVLLEPQRTNLALYSEQFDNAWWSKANAGVASAPVVTANAEISPDGTQNADRIVFTLNGGTASGDISQLESTAFVSVSLTRTQSVYIKTTDNTTKVFTFVTPTGAVQAITVTGTYQRFTLTATGVAAGSVRLRLRGSSSAEGTATSATIAIWGMQYEDGAYATTYIPTTSATATRVADTATVTGVSSLIGQSAGTIFWDITDISGTPTSTGNPDFGVRNTAFTNWIGITTNGFNSPFRVTVRPTTGSIIDYTANITRAKACVAWSSAGAVLYVNGVQVATSAVNPNFSFDRIDMLGGIISYRTNQFALFTTRLTDAQLATLTTL